MDATYSWLFKMIGGDMGLPINGLLKVNGVTMELYLQELQDRGEKKL